MANSEFLRLYLIQNANKFHVDSFRYGCRIYLHRKSNFGGDPELVLEWSGYKLEPFVKNKWYFRYRAALLQIANPKRLVELREFNEPHVDDADVLLLRLKNKLRNALAQVSAIENKIQLARDNWNGLFPIESDPLWEKVQAKLLKKQKEFQAVEQELNELQLAIKNSHES